MHISFYCDWASDRAKCYFSTFTKILYFTCEWTGLGKKCLLSLRESSKEEFYMGMNATNEFFWGTPANAEVQLF